MTADEFQRMLDKLKWDTATVNGYKPLTAAVLGVHERTVRRWFTGERAIPEPVAKLLRVIYKFKIDPRKVIDL